MCPQGCRSGTLEVLANCVSAVYLEGTWGDSLNVVQRPRGGSLSLSLIFLWVGMQEIVDDGSLGASHGYGKLAYDKTFVGQEFDIGFTSFV